MGLFDAKKTPVENPAVQKAEIQKWVDDALKAGLKKLGPAIDEKLAAHSEQLKAEIEDAFEKQANTEIANEDGDVKEVETDQHSPYDEFGW